MNLNIDDSLQELITDLIRFVPNLIVALITFGAALIVAQPAARGVQRMVRRRVSNQETVLMISRLVRWSVITIGTIMALDQVNFDVTGFIAGIGVVGITIGFALQDVASNFIAGLLLFARQPFKIGDNVMIANYAGKVLEITTRDTLIETWDGERVILANTDVLRNPIVNYSAMEQRRRTIYIGLGYGQSATHAIEVFGDAIRSVEGVLETPEPMVHAEELSDATITLAARFWLDPRTHNLLEVHSQVVLAIDTAAEREGIELPYPIQTVRVASLGGIERDGYQSESI